ncbi:unnamed protein product [Rhizoctonia solani]|uniref:F-box domain-containing protein n=1 Tax=Rhizoctonia solani TaxID=456999 RepID=A0A8H3G698_9AGAM|nr:unnamed protein product [Rhizoctonia solani]
MQHMYDHTILTAPINKLPTELLIDIFLLVLKKRCHNPHCTGGNRSENRIRYPDRLAHVCYRWHEIVISLPLLWTHIDLNPRTSMSGSLVHHARNYTNRAGRLTLDLHLDDRGCTRTGACIIEDIVSFTADRTQSLDFIITSPEILHFHRFVFEQMIPRLSPRVFKTLRISCEVSLPDPFIAGRDSDPWLVQDSDNPNDYDWGPNILRWKQEIINNSFSGVANLHLQGVFFNWSSMLYHGLIDLRLTSPPIGRATDIDIYTLNLVLSKCPGLQIFHFSLQLITHEVADDEVFFEQPCDPVSLPVLEVIEVSTAHAYTGGRPSFHAGSLLRLLAPGSKPLRLTLETGHSPNEPLFNSDGMKEFLARSRVELLCVRSGHPLMDELRLCHLPDLKVLMFDSCRRISASPNPNWSLEVQSFFVNATTLNLKDLHSMVRLCRNELVLSMCRVLPMLADEKKAHFMPQEELQAMFPTVKFTPSERLWCDLVARWDILD